MTYESEGLLLVANYIWLPPASYVVFLTTLVELVTSTFLTILMAVELLILFIIEWEVRSSHPIIKWSRRTIEGCYPVSFVVF